LQLQVEELRRKYSARIQEQEEQIENLLVKINNLEKQKSRLQSEVEVLIIDLEKVIVSLTCRAQCFARGVLYLGITRG
jgi:chaperonin cofactor prefoldin